jgi:hypothetical protein
MSEVQKNTNGVGVNNESHQPWPFRGWGMDMIGKINPPSNKGH